MFLKKAVKSKQIQSAGNSLAVQWWALMPPLWGQEWEGSGGADLNPDWRTKIPQAMRCHQKKKLKRKDILLNYLVTNN